MISGSFTDKCMLIEEAFNSASVGIVIYDADKNCILKNNTFDKLLNLPQEFTAGNFRFDDLVELCFKRGDYGKHITYEDVIYFYTSRMSGQSELRMDLMISNGQWIEIAHVPLSNHYSMFTYKDITISKKHEEQSRKFESILQSIDDAIVIKNVSGEIVDWNYGAEKLFGYSKEEVLGKPTSILFPHDSRNEGQDILSDLCFGQKVKSIETIRLKKDGSPIHVSVTITPLYDKFGKVIGACKIARNIEDKVNIQNELELAQQVFLSANEAIMVCDDRNKIVSVNPAFSKITGYEPDDALGKNPSFLASGKHDKSFYSDMWREIITTGNWNGEVINCKKSGEEYVEWLRISSAHKQDGSIHRRIAIFSDITEKKRTEERIWHAANYDRLTQLPNRNFFQSKLREHIAASQRYHNGFALLFLDLDKFKEVNDTYGHFYGDILLKQVAKRIIECVRKTDFVSRLGGDEFTVILTGLLDTKKIAEITQKILNSLRCPFDLGLPDHISAFISCSIGITLYPSDANTDMELIKNADKAMYASKKNGRDCFSYFSEKI